MKTHRYILVPNPPPAARERRGGRAAARAAALPSGPASRPWALLAALSALWLLLSISAALAAIPFEVGHYKVELTSDPAVLPSSGKAKLRFQVTGHNGKPVTGATVTSLTSMPGMAMGEREETAVPEPGQPGTYVAPATFPHGGQYQVTVKISGPQGSGTGSVPISTGQNTAAGGGSPLRLLLWLAVLGLVAFTAYRLWKTGWRPSRRLIPDKPVIGGLSLLVIMVLLASYAVSHWRAKGAMTPIEAQAMDMSYMPAPEGTVAVELARVERGPVEAATRYTGTAVGFVEQDIYPRTQGWITQMTVYAGDRVKRGQLLARLDTSELESRVAERQAARRMAEQTAAISQSGYRQSLASASQAQAEISAKQGMLEEARQARVRAQAALKQARYELSGARGQLAEAQQALSAAQAEQSEADADLVAAQAMMPEAEAQLAGAKADQSYMTAELTRSQRLVKTGVISTAEYQRDLASAQNADARVSQAQARVRQVQAQIRAARSKKTRADAMEKAAQARINQMQSGLDASQAKVEQAQADLAAMGGRVRQSEADVQAARANARALQAAAEAARAQVDQAQAGVAEAAAGLTTQEIVKGYTEIRSQVDGVVTRRNISPGVLVGPGQSILKVAQISPLRLQVNVPEEDLTRIRKGNPVRVRAAKDDGPEVTATVTSIFPAVDPTARTGVVEALLPNRDARFLPGQYVTLEISTGESQEALRVPSQALVWRTTPSQFGQSGDQKASVWLAERSDSQGATTYTCPMHPEIHLDKPGLCPKCKMDLVPEKRGGAWTARRVDVTVGQRNDRYAEVLSGLEEGAYVVASGYQGLRDGVALAPTNPEIALTQTASGSLERPAGHGSGVAAPADGRQVVAALGPSKDGEVPAAQGDGKYYCPMHPEVTSNNPDATCDKCGGMKLRPRTEGKA